MKIYLCYVVTYHKKVKERIVTTVFSEKDKAKAYCKYWNKKAIEECNNKVYYYEERILDLFAKCF